MKAKFALPLLCILTLPLAGCMSRDDADARLAKGCQAGAEMFIKEGFKIKEIKRSSARPSTEFGSGFRDVTLFGVESDGWIDFDREYRCTFAEEMGFLGMHHRATIYQIRVNDEIYGKSGNQIMGEADTIANMTRAVEDAMRE